jgi:hypothetical protein
MPGDVGAVMEEQHQGCDSQAKPMCVVLVTGRDTDQSRNGVEEESGSTDKNRGAPAETAEKRRSSGDSAGVEPQPPPQKRQKTDGEAGRPFPGHFPSEDPLAFTINVVSKL